ncbi:MAG TPA: trypsin-like peptidase domain-containing protein [Jatrophihabitantaceae bacterium]|jgi:S1-C subfamily serine protease
MTSDDSGLPSDPTADREYARPDGVDDSFAPRDPEPLYTPPPPTVSPEEQAEFGRPSGEDVPFAPLPGERIAPSHRVVGPPVPAGMSREYGRPPGAEGFDPEPGTRLYPSGRPPESPWWKADARRDPWRDPRSPFWLGRPAVFAGGRPAQLNPDEDSEQDDELPAAAEPETPPDEPTNAVRGGRFGLSALVIALVVALVAGALGGGAGYWFAVRGHSALHNGDVKLAKGGTPANRPPGSIADIARRVTPAVVLIEGKNSQEYGIGSGVVIQKAGYILTNNHVVSEFEQNSRITVTFSDNTQAAAKIVGQDAKTDLAVLKVNKSKLTVAQLGDSDKLAVGDPVVAIGAPLGLSFTVTQGIVSALDRPQSEGGDPDAPVLDAIQTDASINEGNSGGALIDASGTVIGINSAGLSKSVLVGGPNGSNGLNFAIPINQARPVAETLIHGGKVQHASIGMVTVSTATTDSVHDGAYVKQVIPEGPGDQAGLKVGDVITVVDSTLIETYLRLTVVVQRHKPGDKVKVRYYRGNKEADVTVTLGTDSN